jgi:hypothetical protein
MQPGASTRTWRIVGFAALLAIVVRMAWLCDDAYITLRSVENLVAGHGPVWNVGERVQAFSHPAWFLLLALGRWLTGECCFTTLAIGGALAMFAAWRLLGVAGAAAPALAVVLCCSRAFTDFATGGLENPLTSALLVALHSLSEKHEVTIGQFAAAIGSIGSIGCIGLSRCSRGREDRSPAHRTHHRAMVLRREERRMHRHRHAPRAFDVARSRHSRAYADLPADRARSLSKRTRSASSTRRADRGFSLRLAHGMARLHARTAPPRSSDV